MIWRRKLGSLIFHWNRWLGSVVLILAIWGIMAFFPGSPMLRQGPGGSFGRDIIAFPNSNWIGAFRIIALIIIGIFLIAPRNSFNVLKRFFAWLGKQFERRPAPRKPVTLEPQPPAHRVLHHRSPVESKPPLPTEMSEPLVPPEVASSMANLEALANKATAMKPDATMVVKPEGEYLSVKLVQKLYQYDWNNKVILLFPTQRRCPYRLIQFC